MPEGATKAEAAATRRARRRKERILNVFFYWSEDVEYDYKVKRVRGVSSFRVRVSP